MKTIYYLVEVSSLGEFNIFQGTELECEAKLIEEDNHPFKQAGTSFYISMNRFN